MATPSVRANRSRFVSVVAWLGILSGACGVFGCLMITFVAPSLRAFVGLLSAGGTLIAALGLRARREWGRQGSMVLLSYSAAMGLYAAIRAPRLTTAQLTTLHVANGQAITAAQLHAAAPALHAAGIASALVAAVIIAVVVVKLSSEHVRQEFDSASSA